MQHRLIITALLAPLVACAVEPTTGTAESAVTVDDTDLAPECAGILTYANAASATELDDFLPSNVVANLVARRAQAPFVDIADLSSVSGIAQARLSAIAERARTASYIDATCAGVYEELAVSADDAAAILGYANTASEAALLEVVRFEKHTVVPALLAARPFANLQGLVDVYGVGTSTFRALRDAAIESPFDELVSRVNDADEYALMRTDFDWFATLYDMPGQPTHLTCWGIASSIVVGQLGGTIRPELADGDEVYARAAEAVAIADRFGEVGDATAGLAHLAAQVDGQTFFGCSQGFAPDPWSGVTRTFYVNTVTGYRVLVETWWVE
ncbi:MAG: hypothetical protein KBG48_13060 [Kofleriaceae bacterium]|jgi:DNA uptake protein ComE-like DNA-binding protein|nr:hypothetical protein [Kofleriaceae bacterium]MBP9168316.1 hypothetical protein [Kofleriaceae bacterium]MBP9857195.1 hypothetical protein [Kofleriaceae bacterium]